MKFKIIFYILVLLFFRIDTAISQNITSFIEYCEINDTISHYIYSVNEINTYSNLLIKTLEKGEKFNKSLNGVLTIAHSSTNKRKAIRSFKEYILHGGDINNLSPKYFEPLFYSILKKKYTKFRSQYLKKKTKYQDFYQTLNQIRVDDQKYRSKLNYSNASNYYIDSLMNLQKVLDSINKIKIYHICSQLFSNYTKLLPLENDSESIVESMTTLTSCISHFKESDVRFFLKEATKYSEIRKCDWQLAKNLMKFLVFKFPIKRTNEFDIIALDFIFFDKHGRLDLKKSYLQLSAMKDFLSDNPLVRVRLCKIQTKPSIKHIDIKCIKIKDINDYLLTYIPSSRVEIENELLTSLQYSTNAMLCWKILKK